MTPFDLSFAKTLIEVLDMQIARSQYDLDLQYRVHHKLHHEDILMKRFHPLVDQMLLQIVLVLLEIHQLHFLYRLYLQKLIFVH